MIKLNDMPTVITGPGDYLLRDGGRATVHNVREPSEDRTVTESLAQGSVWRMFRGKVRPKGYQIWHISGRLYILRESPKDIVGVWVED